MPVVALREAGDGVTDEVLLILDTRLACISCGAHARYVGRGRSSGVICLGERHGLILAFWRRGFMSGEEGPGRALVQCR